MDCSPVTVVPWFGGEITSKEPSTKKIEPVVRLDVSTQLRGLLQKDWAGSSMGRTVLMAPADLIRALIAPVEQCEAPKEPIWVTLSLLWKMLAGLALAAMRKLAASRMVWPTPVFLSSVAMITKPQEAMCLIK